MMALKTARPDRREQSPIVAVALVLVLCFGGCSVGRMDVARRVSANPLVALADYHGLKRPEEIEAWFHPFRIAMTLVIKSDYEQMPAGIQEVVTALQKRPDNPYSWWVLGLLFALQHKREIAVEAVRESARLMAAARERDPVALNALRERNREAFMLIDSSYTSVLASLGMFLNYIERYDDALDTLRVLEPSTLDPPARLVYYWTLTMTYAGLGHFREATAALNESLKITEEELQPIHSIPPPPWCPRCNTKQWRDAILQYLLGLIALKRGDLDTAERHLREAIEIESQIREPYYLLAETLIHAGKEDAARGVLDHLLRTLPPDGLYPLDAAYAALGAVEKSDGRFVEAAAHYRKATKMARERAQRFRDRVIRGTVIDGSTRAGDMLRRSVDPARDGLPDAEVSLASIEVSFLAADSVTERSRRGFEIEDLYRRAANNPTYEKRHVAEALLAKYYWNEGRHSDALSAMARSLRLRLDFSSIELFVQLPSPTDNPEATLAALTLILDALSEFRVSLRDIGGQMNRVTAATRQQLKLLPESLGRLRAMSKVHFLTNERAENKSLLRTVATEHPDAVFAHIGLAMLAVADEEWDEARSRLNTILTSIGSTAPSPASTPDVRDAHYLRGQVRLHDRDFAGARADFAEALRIWPEWPPAKLALLSIPASQ